MRVRAQLQRHAVRATGRAGLSPAVWGAACVKARPGWTLGHTSLLVLALLAAPSRAKADAPVTGEVRPPPRAQPPRPAPLGFLAPIENPLVEVRPYDPLPECFVALDGGPVTQEPGPRAPVIWSLHTYSLSPPVLPVVTGSVVEIANLGRETHILRSDDRTDLVAREPLGPGTTRQITVGGETRAIRITSSQGVLDGRVVPLPTRLFSRLDRGGRFSIDAVPAGRWNVKVWYRDGWVWSGTVEVATRPVTLRIELGELPGGRR